MQLWRAAHMQQYFIGFDYEVLTRKLFTDNLMQIFICDVITANLPFYTKPTGLTNLSIYMFTTRKY